MFEIMRFWQDTGWVHVVLMDGHEVARSRCLSDIQDEYPNAVRTGRVVCGTNTYYEGEAA
jgi:hypothetical protein